MSRLPIGEEVQFMIGLYNPKVSQCAKKIEEISNQAQYQHWLQ